MKTLLEKKKAIRNVGIIILLVISIIILCLLIRMSMFKDKVEDFRYKETILFYNITNGNDTCLVVGSLACDYYTLNIKVLDQKTFDYHFMRKVLNKEVIEVSEKYYKENEPYCLIPVDAINDIYDNHGVDSLLIYLDNYPINQLYRYDIKSFYWAAYILWENDIYVSLDTEVFYWYIDFKLE